METKQVGIVSVACFGAIRPMKNTLLQAMASIVFAEKIGKILHFHINTRCEQNGEPIYRNLMFLFKHTKHQLIEHSWMPHEDFLDVIKEMDLGLQVSFSETFNIVAADMVVSNIPLIGSKEITWLSNLFQVDNPCDIDDIVDHLLLAYYGKESGLQRLNTMGLDQYNFKATESWIELLGK